MTPVEDQPRPHLARYMLPIFKAFSEPGRVATIDILNEAAGPIRFVTIHQNLNHRVEDGSLQRRHRATGPLPPSTVTAYLKDLMRADLVSCEPSVKRYELTDFGRTAYEKIIPFAQALDDVLKAKQLEKIGVELQQLVARNPRMREDVVQMIRKVAAERNIQLDQ